MASGAPPPDDADYSGRWRALNKAFTWLRRFREHTIRDDRDDTAHTERAALAMPEV